MSAVTGVREVPSPNFDARRGPPRMVVLHYTGMRSGAAALERLCDPLAKVSAHYVLEEDGALFRLVPEERRAWHAGVSFWRGERDVNGASIGVELVNPGHDIDLRPYPDAQIARLIGLLDEIRTRWAVADEDIVGHSDVAPDRKIDPGELFPWDRLKRAGHGLYPDLEGSAKPERLGAPLGLGAEGVDVFALQAGLSRLGFDLPPDGRFDVATACAVTAFQRHWRARCVDGLADGETRLVLMSLLRSLPKAAAPAS